MTEEEITQRIVFAEQFLNDGHKAIADNGECLTILFGIADFLLASLRDARQDGARLDWLEANGRALMCWNVSDDPTEEHWHAPMSPNNGWTVSPLDPEDGEDYQGNTARDAIDWAIKSERASVASSGTPGEQQP